MGTIVVSQFMTVDGTFEDPGGSEHSPFGGWAFWASQGEKGGAFKLEELMGAEALLLGRVTYEGFAAAWPEREGEFADRFNGMRKYVVSTTLTAPEWNNTVVLAGGDAADEIRRVRDETDGVLLVAGSAQLVRLLLDENLVDELRVMVFPAIVGGGKKLFADGTQLRKLKQVATLDAGEVFVVTYRPA
jgi:dihydrofolate reductase